MKSRTAPILLLTAISGLNILAQSAQAKPDFSGTWVFSVQKSILKVPPPSSMTLQIEQKDPQVTFARKQVYGDVSFDWKLEAVADGQKEVVQDAPGYTTHSRVYWQGTAMVVDSEIVASDGTKVTDQVTYTLADGGKLLEAVEHQATVGGKGSATNKWVYEKKAQ
jgi:hypothetical protein